MLFSFILFTLVSAAEPQTAPFRDLDLDLAFKSTETLGDSAVIYSWSPHMNLSVQGIPEIMEYGRQNKIWVIVVLDPDSNFKLASEIVAKNKWPHEFLRPNLSLSLFKRGTRIHYPSYHFISKAKFSRPPLPGYKLAKELDDFRKVQSR